MPTFRSSGGPVQGGEIYIERKPDRQILQWVVREFEYVHLIASRQMGKTSLLYRLTSHVRERGWRCVYVDLSQFPSKDEEAWYAGLGRWIGQQLSPEQVPKLGSPIDFKIYLADTLAATRPAVPILLVLDEIGSLKTLPSCEQFLMTVRSMYRRPIDYPVLEHLTFVLAGATDPDAMVRDPNISPFNIGERVTLDDFDAEQTRQLTLHLKDVFGQDAVSDTVHERIYEWTGGHPYLTQKVCALLECQHTQGDLETLAPRDVDRMVRAHLLKPPTALDVDSNVRHILEGLQGEGLQETFKQVRSGEPSLEPLRTHLYQLSLLGAIKRDQDRFVVRNRIYRELALSSQIVPSSSQRPGSPKRSKHWVQLLLLRPLRWLGQMTRKVGAGLGEVQNVVLGLLVIVVIVLVVLGVISGEELFGRIWDSLYPLK